MHDRLDDKMANLEIKGLQDEPLMKKLNEIQDQVKSTNNSKEKDNKQKIQQFNDIFEKDLITVYEDAFKGLLYMAQDQVTQEYLSELYLEKLNAAENLNRKHELLAKEYSKQNRDFKVKHEEVKFDETSKREEVEKNFDDHYARIRQQMAEEEKEMVNEEGKYLIDVETDEMEAKYVELMKEIDEKRTLFKEQGVQRKETKD